MVMNNLLEKIRDEAIKRGATFADARIVERDLTQIVRQDKRADKLGQTNSQGLGVRVLKDGAWGFASLSDVDEASAMECLASAFSMSEASKARVDEPGMVATVDPVVDTVTTPFEKDPRSIPLERKMEALVALENDAIAICGDKLANSVLMYFDLVQRETVCNTFGTLVESNSVRTLMGATFVVRDGDVLQRGSARVGRMEGFELVERINPEKFNLKAARQAVSLLTATLAPAGNFPVIFHPSITGLLTHEAIGHNAEGDTVLGGGSIIEGKIGQTIGSELVTIIDDATIPGVWGSYPYDSEGVPSQRRVLIENGKLVGYMHSLETAAKLGMTPNGSARADGYRSRPIVRMSNTFIVPGKTSFEDMLKGIDLGVYLTGGEYGYVFCERGQYTCHAGEAYMIRNGQLAEHLRDVSVSGMTLETLMNIDAVSDGFEMEMPGTCGKDGQGMQVDNGGPYVRVKELVVGGHA
jgi:TldD protein